MIRGKSAACSLICMSDDFTSVLEVSDYGVHGWPPDVDAEERAHFYCSALEHGEILLFPQLPIDLSQADAEYLTSRVYSGSRLHKNVSYRPQKDVLRGFSGSADEEPRVHAILRHYSRETVRFVSSFLQPYSGKLRLDFASFRPLEEENRNLPLHKRNDLLHVDAFPTRPTAGARILRVFTNINPSQSRVWLAGPRFRSLAKQHANAAGLERFASANTKRRLAAVLRSLGLPFAARSAYDEFMLRFHDFLKETSELQSNRENRRIEFPPMSTWLVYTDGVSHAALSGQFALEQTFFVPHQALVSPEDAPIRILEALCRRRLAA
jgi:hypothetical protein